jgi:hypothetical protein
MVGTVGDEMLKDREFRDPPPGLNRPTFAVSAPPTAMASGGMIANNWVELTRVVARFHCGPCRLNSTITLGLKPTPVTLRVSCGLPVGAELGLILLKTGST